MMRMPKIGGDNKDIFFFTSGNRTEFAHVIGEYRTLPLYHQSHIENPVMSHKKRLRVNGVKIPVGEKIWERIKTAPQRLTGLLPKCQPQSSR
jgi:hypothetical protein